MNDYLISFLIIAAIILVGFGLAFLVFRIFQEVSDQERHYWRAIRFNGGGQLQSPEPMTESEAADWISKYVKGEIAFIDRECGFIFYRPKE